jgi:hypothetical protein
MPIGENPAEKSSRVANRWNNAAAPCSPLSPAEPRRQACGCPRAYARTLSNRRKRGRRHDMKERHGPDSCGSIRRSFMISPTVNVDVSFELKMMLSKQSLPILRDTEIRYGWKQYVPRHTSQGVCAGGVHDDGARAQNYVALEHLRDR